MKFIHIAAAQPEVYAGRNIAHNGMTVGYEFLDGDKRDETGKVVQVGTKRSLVVTYARCSSGDAFNKKKSRWICTGRLEKGTKVAHLERPEEQGVYEFLLSQANQHDMECRIQARKIADQRTRKLRKINGQVQVAA